MDRYIIRERRPGVEHPQGNQMMAFSPSSATGNNITMPDAYYGACEPPVQRMGAGFAHNSHLNQNIQNTPHFMPNNMLPNSTQMVSGIDPRYLAAYSGNNLPYITATPTGQQIQHTGQVQHEQMFLPEDIAFGSNYQNRNLVPVEKHVAKPFAQPRIPASPRNENQRVAQEKARTGGSYTTMKELGTPKTLVQTNSATTRKQSEVNLLKNEASQVRSRSEKLKALHKSGARAFSGPVEKVLKWHKSLQDIGLLVFYEIVAKCVSIRPGERCAKNIVVRDDNGPAIQVVYYEVDFLLPDLKPPCTVRVVGRMMPGTCRLHAFNVRLATGDDVATLPRRAAVAAHHVAKLNSEYGKDSDKITIIIP